MTKSVVRENLSAVAEEALLQLLRRRIGLTGSSDWPDYGARKSPEWRRYLQMLVNWGMYLAPVVAG
jgi:hypothetical protein